MISIKSLFQLWPTPSGTDRSSKDSIVIFAECWIIFTSLCVPNGFFFIRMLMPKLTSSIPCILAFGTETLRLLRHSVECEQRSFITFKKKKKEETAAVHQKKSPSILPHMASFSDRFQFLFLHRVYLLNGSFVRRKQSKETRHVLNYRSRWDFETFSSI